MATITLNHLRRLSHPRWVALLFLPTMWACRRTVRLLSIIACASPVVPTLKLSSRYSLHYVVGAIAKSAAGVLPAQR